MFYYVCRLGKLLLSPGDSVLLPGNALSRQWVNAIDPLYIDTVALARWQTVHTITVRLLAQAILAASTGVKSTTYVCTMYELASCKFALRSGEQFKHFELT